MNIILDIIAVLKRLSFIDYVLYFSVLALIILTITLLFIIKDEDEQKKLGSDSHVEDNEIDLKTIRDTIDENPKPLIDMTSYEEEQEQKAIISYDELLKEANKKQLNYTEEKLVDDCIPVKKIDLNNILNEPIINDINVIDKEEKKLNLFHYEQEEAFLKALKELNELLN